MVYFAYIYLLVYIFEWYDIIKYLNHTRVSCRIMQFTVSSYFMFLYFCVLCTELYISNISVKNANLANRYNMWNIGSTTCETMEI